MKYMLMMHAPRGKGDWEAFNWPAEDLKAHIGFMRRFNEDLSEAGEFVEAQGWPGRTRREWCEPGKAARPT